MLHEFLLKNRGELIERCRAKVKKRAAPEATEDQLDHGVPFFLDQLIKTLSLEQSERPLEGHKVSGPPGGGTPVQSELGDMAARHGGELMRRGFTVEQVVHDYGDLCQSVTDMAFELSEPMAVDEFRTLNRCLDNAIAMAVTEFNYQRDFVVADVRALELNEQIGAFVHELRNFLYTATLAVEAIKEGGLGLGGGTGTVLERALGGIRVLIDRSLTEIRMNARLEPSSELFGLADFIDELKLSAMLESQVRRCPLVVSAVDFGLALCGDRGVLMSAVSNLLQNAFKFTSPHTAVLLNGYAIGDRIRIDVEDHGPGLPAGQMEEMFQPFTQGKTENTGLGLGLGLSISRRGVESNGGVLSVRNKEQSGCVFSVDMPRHMLPVFMTIPQTGMP